MGDQEPPSKRTKQSPPLQIKLKDASNGEKKLIIKHPSLSKATGCSLDSDVGQFQISCGGIRYVPRCTLLLTAQRQDH